MKLPKILNALVLTAAFAFGQQASAAIVYGDNAGTDLVNAVALNGGQSAFDDFVLDSITVLNSFTFWAVMDPGVDAQINANTFDMQVLVSGSNGSAPDFGSFLAITGASVGTATATGDFWSPIPQLNLPVYEVTYELAGPLELNPGEYWFALATAEAANISWMSHTPVNGSVAHADPFAAAELRPLQHDLAFVLHGYEIPVPAPLMLMGFGLLLLRRVVK